MDEKANGTIQADEVIGTLDEQRVREVVREELYAINMAIGVRDANGSIPAKWPNDEPMNRPTPAETEAGRKVMDALRGLSIREAQALLKDCSKRLVENLPLNADLGLDTII